MKLHAIVCYRGSAHTARRDRRIDFCTATALTLGCFSVRLAVILVISLSKPFRPRKSYRRSLYQPTLARTYPTENHLFASFDSCSFSSLRCHSKANYIETILLDFCETRFYYARMTPPPWTPATQHADMIFLSCSTRSLFDHF